MEHHIINTVTLIVCVWAMRAFWLRFGLFLKNDCKAVSPHLAWALKISTVAIPTFMMVHLIFEPVGNNYGLGAVIPITAWGLLILWYVNIVGYWLFFCKGFEDGIRAGIFKNQYSKKAPPPSVRMLKIGYFVVWVSCVFLGLLLLVADHIEWVVEHTPWMVNWLRAGGNQ